MVLVKRKKNKLKNHVLKIESNLSEIVMIDQFEWNISTARILQVGLKKRIAVIYDHSGS